MSAANDVPASTVTPCPATAPALPALPVRGVDGLVPLNADARIAAWQRLQFGLFVHWGVYSLYEGSYRGVPQGIGYPEQIKAWMQIPDEEYLQAAREWHAEEWDAAALCAAAKAAGMTYVMITTKHHDGFCMWNTATTDFNIVAQSAFGRDPLAELARECAAQGLGLAFYFSIIDWTQHEAEPYANLNAIPESMMPLIVAQIEELLTNYGPIVEFWFDMGGPTPDQSERLAATVRRCQPSTTVMNSRVWNDCGDFEVGGDNDIPDFFQYGPWESVRSIFPAAWSYCTTDKCDRSPETIIPQVRAAIGDLVTVLSGGGQFAYNIGPMGSGAIDPYDRQVLEGIGAWMARHPRALRGARPTWLPIEAASGAWRATATDSELYLFPAQWEEGLEIRLPGVANAVWRAEVDAAGAGARGGVSTVRAVSGVGTVGLVGGDTHAACTSGTADSSSAASLNSTVFDEAARALPVRREGNECVVTLVGPCPDDIQPVVRLELDGPLRLLPATAVPLAAAPEEDSSRAWATLRGCDLVAHRSAKGYGGGFAAFDAVVFNASDTGFPHVSLRFFFDEGDAPSPTTMYRLTWGDTSIDVSGTELAAGPIRLDTHVGAHVGAHAAARLRIEYAHPFYYADALDLRVASIEVECFAHSPSPSVPVVSAEPASVGAYAGERVRLAAAVSGWPAPSYQWYRVDVDALDSEGLPGVAIPGATASVLEIAGPEISAPESAGAQHAHSSACYVLVATNEHGSVTTQPATITLRSGEAQRGVPPRVGAITVEAVMGENLSMSGDGANRIVTISAGTVLGCAVEVSGDPYPTLQWQLLPSGAVDWEDLPGQSAPTWTRIIDESFNGAKLRVQAANPAGVVTSGMVTLRVF
ncbi:alpha-L-fucosidase [Schaalia sp. Marseille-Q2122]|uniref:alpha-L-fucosidase n=1 Tax=Schaalia sp. Marseille-Q2122 TaxID=2736604 RepID=UPI00158F4DEE|nr:alpha-L-fucosidase [Schaalia sp. Marseille-Q2122]